jgi:hypothetical protein
LKVQELAGWPPREFQCTEDPTIPFKPALFGGLRIEGVSYVAGHAMGKSVGDMVLSLVDFEKAEHCTTRFKISDDTARRAQIVLAQCKGLTLAQAGLREIPEDEG